MPTTLQPVHFSTRILAILGFAAALGLASSTVHAADYPTPVPTPGQNVVQVVNESPVTILIGVFGPTEIQPREGHWDLAPGGYLTFDIPLAWRNSTTQGSHGPRFWARTGCRYDTEQDIAQCETGECGGLYDCSRAHLAGLAPTTLGEWCFNCGNDFNYWDISAVDGVNLSMDIQPLGTYSPENPKSPGDTFWCQYPNAVSGADLRGSCPSGFQLKRSDLGSYIIGSADGVVACFSNCGKYEYPVAPNPNCPDSDPSCYAWKQFCCNAPPSEYGKACSTDSDCEYGDACWHLPDKSVCACRGYVVDPPCPDDVCTNQNIIAQPPYGTCSEPECIGDDTVHKVLPRAYTWPNDPQTYDCDATAYRITFSPGGTTVATTNSGGIPLCSSLPAAYGYETAKNLCSGTADKVYGGARPSPANWDCKAPPTSGVLCKWGLGEPPPEHACDCNGDSAVSVDELVRAVGIALGEQPLEQCDAADVNNDGDVSVDELMSGVNAALGQ